MACFAGVLFPLPQIVHRASIWCPSLRPFPGPVWAPATQASFGNQMIPRKQHLAAVPPFYFLCFSCSPPGSTRKPGKLLLMSPTWLGNRELKHARFWDADGNRKRAIITFNLPSHYRIHIAKYLFSIRNE